MYLGLIKETVEMIATAISKALDVDVMIVDQDLNRVGDTFRYPDKPIPIRRMSIIGKVISTGEILTVDDKTDYYVCKNCPDISECEINGFIGVPIYFHNEVVGAIALIVPNCNNDTLYKNFKNSKDFLVKMADLLSSKIQNIYDYNHLNLIKKEREIIMDSMIDAIFSIDELGYITYYNKKFINYFQIEKNLVGLNFYDTFNHPTVKECFENRSNISNKLIFADKNGKFFYGFLSTTSILIDGVFKGMLYIFKSLNRFNHALNNLTNKADATFTKFSETYCEKQKKMLTEAKKLSVTDQIILIESEGNCGEELLAQSIHNFSARSDNSFLKIDCSFHPVNILEKEIFGLENSPDMSESMGKILLSHKGTLYFHEINQLPLYLQKRITSFIKTKMISNNMKLDLHMDTRLVFSTRVSLVDLVKAGKFDEELYYWIGSNKLSLPPLRERKQDLPMLIKFNLEYFSKRFHVSTPIIHADLMANLCAYDWPNNLKELEQITEQIAYHAKGKTITAADISYLSLDFTPKKEKSMSIDEIEKEHIALMLASNKSKEEIARLLNISRGTLYRKIKKYNLNF